MAPPHNPEYALLGGETPTVEATGSTFRTWTAPVFTGDALEALGSDILPQRAIYGRVLDQKVNGFPKIPSSPILYINTNAPFSGLVCGLQGAGTSHSTSILLESCLVSDPRLGTLPKPLSALVFRFDTGAGGAAVQPCEAAYLSTFDAQRAGDALPPTVTVLVLPSNVQAMRKVYAKLPAVRVEPLHFSPEDISGERLLAMMKVDNGRMPTGIMEAVITIFRTMDTFDYSKFRQELKALSFNATHREMLSLHLSLLEPCVKGGNTENRASTYFKKGHLTIIDLSSPLMDRSSACAFFDLILGLFIEADVKATGKILVLDEVHKYLNETQTGSSSRFIESLLTVIRQCRHLGIRTIISTQEPTIVPSKILALCSFIIAHRLHSPEWLRSLTKHVSIRESNFNELFAKVVGLQTGQAIMFAPCGLCAQPKNDIAAQQSSESDSSMASSGEAGAVVQLGEGYMLVQSRLRVTRDGGHPVLAVRDPARATRVGVGLNVAPAGPSEKRRDAGPSDASSSASAGGTSASTSRPVEIIPPPPPYSEAKTTPLGVRPPSSAEHAASVVQQLTEIATEASSIMGAGSRSSTPTTDHAAEGPSANDALDALSGPSVFVMASPELRKFHPLVEFLQKVFREENLWRVKTQRIRSTLGLEPDDLMRASELGVVVRAEGTGQTRVMLKPGAEYIMERTAYLTGPHRDFIPLIQYLKEQASQGFHEITAARLRKRFGQEIEEILSKAKAQVLVEDVPSAANRKIRLAPHTKFVF